MITNHFRIFVVLSVLVFSPIICDVNLAVWSKTETVSAVYATIGRRPKMEDQYIRIESINGTGVYAIFDGHSGGFSSKYAKKYFTEAIQNELELYASGPKNCKYTDEEDDKLDLKRMLTEQIGEADNYLKNKFFNKKHRSGTTCLIAIAEKKKLTVANVGDSRGVMCDKNGKTFNLSIDHKPNNKDEKKRIEEAKGEIYESSPGIWRVRHLAMSRSLGDYGKKGNDNIIIATPDFLTFDLNEYQPKFIILASDGLWDVMKSEEAVKFIEERFLKQNDFGAGELVHKAYELKSADNISVVIAVFKNGFYEVRSAKA